MIYKTLHLTFVLNRELILHRFLQHIPVTLKIYCIIEFGNPKGALSKVFWTCEEDAHITGVYFFLFFIFQNSSVCRVKACFSWYCLDWAVCSALNGNLKGCHFRTAGMNLNMCVQNIDLGDLANKRYRQKWYHFFKLYQMQKCLNIMCHVLSHINPAFWYMNLSVGWKYCSLTHVRQAPSSSRDVRQPHLVS